MQKDELLGISHLLFSRYPPAELNSKTFFSPHIRYAQCKLRSESNLFILSILFCNKTGTPPLAEEGGVL